MGRTTGQSLTIVELDVDSFHLLSRFGFFLEKSQLSQQTAVDLNPTSILWNQVPSYLSSSHFRLDELLKIEGDKKIEKLLQFVVRNSANSIRIKIMEKF